MSDPDSGFTDALRLEDIHFIQWITESSLEVNEKIRAAEQNLAASVNAGLKFPKSAD